MTTKPPTTTEIEDWFKPLSERYVEEQTSVKQKFQWIAAGLPEQNFIDYSARLKEGYDDCYDFVEWAFEQGSIKRK